ncbi:hypothetical protein [Mucilaginibacter lacusdianchii]|uniref:hypothetical protein n=1 Tax=Mucilaginibacter lacusdianchii TaxID=2684211 RepID=UPI00131DC28D|nr:hypothetical protein [Mucilaginibacter sp. JXJ CY 39]
MVKSALWNAQRKSPVLGGIVCGVLSLCFKPTADKQQALFWGNRCLIQAYDSSGDGRLKNWSLNITDDSFLRLRKTYYNGRQEYFSFSLRRFNDFSYLGTETSGIIRMYTKADDIIVQTYRDPKGDIDSMAHTLNVPVRNLSSGQLDTLRNTLLFLKSQLQ